jgi:hypothetical protein
LTRTRYIVLRNGEVEHVFKSEKEAFEAAEEGDEVKKATPEIPE